MHRSAFIYNFKHTATGLALSQASYNGHYQVVNHLLEHMPTFKIRALIGLIKPHSSHFNETIGQALLFQYHESKTVNPKPPHYYAIQKSLLKHLQKNTATLSSVDYCILNEASWHALVKGNIRDAWCFAPEGPKVITTVLALSVGAITATIRYSK
jgi:hypothetical protein